MQVQGKWVCEVNINHLYIAKLLHLVWALIPRPRP